MKINWLFNLYNVTKEIPINNIVNSVSIVQSSILSSPKLMICYPDKCDICNVTQSKPSNGFINLNKKKNNEIIFDSIIKEDYGELIKIIKYDNNILVCYEGNNIHICIFRNFETNRLNLFLFNIR